MYVAPFSASPRQRAVPRHRRMAVLIVHFLEAMQIQHHQAQRQSVTPGAIEFFFESLAEKPAIIKSRERIGDRIHLQHS